MACPAVGSQPPVTSTEKPPEKSQQSHIDPLFKMIAKIAQETIIRGVVIINDIYLHEKEVKTTQETKTPEADASDKTTESKRQPVEPDLENLKCKMEKAKTPQIREYFAKKILEKEAEITAYAKTLEYLKNKEIKETDPQYKEHQKRIETLSSDLLLAREKLAEPVIESQIVIGTQTLSQQSLYNCQKNHKMRNGYCAQGNWSGSWQDEPPAGIENFPTYLPLAMFIKQDGKFVEHGDKIRFEYQGRQIELTVCHNKKNIDSTSYEKFSELLEAMVKLSGSMSCFASACRVDDLRARIKAGEPTIIHLHDWQVYNGPEKS
jgi:hypothetical protein